jgi:hypothetical protein
MTEQHHTSRPYMTAGELLCHHLRTQLFPAVPWHHVSDHLEGTGRIEQLLEFFQEVVVVNMTCRLVVAGTSLMKAKRGSPGRNATDAAVQRQLKQYLRDRLEVSTAQIEPLLHRLTAALEATEEPDLSPRETAAFRSWAQRLHPLCYMCGEHLDFTGTDRNREFTREHLWPHCYGGNSVKENLLPSCGKCNHERKRDLASWAMISVQALVQGFIPRGLEPGRIEGSYKFALHDYSARELAARERLSLKEAFLKLGHWGDLRLKDVDDVADFFNLEIHQDLPNLR